MKRLKSIDIFRGFNMVLMVWVHLRDWWITGGPNSTLNAITRSFIDRSSAGMFLLISGVSTFISYHNRLKKVSDEYTFQTLRKEYFFRALLIFLVGLIYNIFVAIRVSDPSVIWTWFMLFSISISLFMTWPFLKKSKLFRIGLAIIVFIVNFILYWFLTQY
ncbi:MAG: heparan-alpha-glucosaminide N-acetyltransferase domain-containing protein, partial [Promethearchaeota archaeon]